MQTLLQSLDSLEIELRNALAKQDWSAVAALDSKCRTLVAEIVALESWNDPVLRAHIERLSGLYAALQQAAHSERERIAHELTRLNKSKQVDQVYKPLG